MYCIYISNSLFLFLIKFSILSKCLPVDPVPLFGMSKCVLPHRTNPKIGVSLELEFDLFIDPFCTLCV